MRAILDQDIDAALAGLMSLPVQCRAAMVLQWLDQAHAADKFRKRTGRAHALWGNGTLAARVAASGITTPPPRRHDAVTLAALAELTVALCHWREGQLSRGRSGVTWGNSVDLHAGFLETCRAMPQIPRV